MNLFPKLPPPHTLVQPEMTARSHGQRRTEKCFKALSLTARRKSLSDSAPSTTSNFTPTAVETLGPEIHKIRQNSSVQFDSDFLTDNRMPSNRTESSEHFRKNNASFHSRSQLTFTVGVLQGCEEQEDDERYFLHGSGKENGQVRGIFKTEHCRL